MKLRLRLGVVSRLLGCRLLDQLECIWNFGLDARRLLLFIFLLGSELMILGRAC